jgi:hypothetical protein
MKAENKFILVSACLYFLSLTQAAFYDASGGDSYGYLRLQMPVYLSHMQFGWVANPLLFCTWLLSYLDRKAPARICAGLAILTGCIFLFQHAVDVDGTDLLRPGAGYLLWMASMVVMALKSMSAHRISHNALS